MEYRRRTLSSPIDDDIEKQLPRRRGTSIDEHIDEHIDYMYSGTFSIFRSIFCGFVKLICPCCIKKRESNYDTLRTM
jgi:hypothetical protein